MSGGSLDYVYREVEQAARDGTVSGDAETVVREIAQLLHDIEWSASGDYARDRWRQTLAEFCSSARRLRGLSEAQAHPEVRPARRPNRGYGRAYRRLYDIDTDERLYEFVRLGDEGRQTVVLEQSEVHDYHEVLFDEGDETA
ncbi:hypothetical protein ACFQHN_26495 [Natrialbaceae archaeon GCM10025896]